MADLGKALLAEAMEHFHAAGVVSRDDYSVLILGLATSPACDLDEFVRDDGRAFQIRGFEAHVSPRLGSLVEAAGRLGLSAEVLGHCGYPPGNRLNLKRQAVAAGIGGWGKNAMLLHPHLGPRLRLAAIKVSGAPLASTGPGLDAYRQNPLCQDCTACIDACPAGVLEPYYLRDRQACLANTSWSPDPGSVVCCDRCWTVCPVGSPVS